MKLTSVQVIRAPRERVYAALLDPEVLGRCIEGCQQLTRATDDVYAIELKVGVAAIKGAYKGTVKILDRKDPESFTLSIHGKGFSGFVQSLSHIRLVEKNGETELHAETEATVGGVIAAVGSRLVEGLAKKMTHDFFAKLAAEVEA